MRGSVHVVIGGALPCGVVQIDFSLQVLQESAILSHFVVNQSSGVFWDLFTFLRFHFTSLTGKCPFESLCGQPVIRGLNRAPLEHSSQACTRTKRSSQAQRLGVLSGSQHCTATGAAETIAPTAISLMRWPSSWSSNNSPSAPWTMGGAMTRASVLVGL